jgi:hypothetical protein
MQVIQNPKLKLAAPILEFGTAKPRSSRGKESKGFYEDPG